MEDVAPQARLGDLEVMDQWLGGTQGRLKGQRIADIAAGGGFLTKKLAEWSGSLVYPVDPSAVQLEALVRYCMGAQIWPVKSSPDSEAMFSQIAAGSLDVVTSFGGLHHVANHEQLFANVARLLKPGGRFVAGDVCNDSSLQRHFDTFVTTYCLTGHTANWLSEAKLRRLCAGLPLTLARVESAVPLTWVFDSEQQMAQFFQGLHAYPLSEEQIIADLKEALGTTVAADGRIHLNWPMLFFEIHRD
jgi:SAM-dependent methyltransferase